MSNGIDATVASMYINVEISSVTLKLRDSKGNTYMSVLNYEELCNATDDTEGPFGFLHAKRKKGYHFIVVDPALLETLRRARLIIDKSYISQEPEITGYSHNDMTRLMR